MKRDSEIVLDRMIAVLQSDLNAAIVAINAEKNDTTILAQVASDAYAMQSLDDRVMNYDPFILVGIDNITSQGIGPATSEILDISAVIILTDSGEDSLIVRRLLRYQRCMKEVIQNNWSDKNLGIRLEITSLVPVQFNLANSSNLFRAIGLQIKTGIG